MGDTDCYRKYLHRFRLDDCSNCPGCGDVPEDTDIPVSEIRKYKPGAEDDVEPKVTQEKKMGCGCFPNYKNTGRATKGAMEKES